jgi:protein SCO1
MQSLQRHVLSWLMILLFAATPALAQFVSQPTADQLPPQLSGVAIEQRLNQQVPLNLTFRDEAGNPVQLKQYFTPGRPVILSLVYFNCRMLCSVVLAALANSMRLIKFDAGNQYDVLTVSFDPRDTPGQAAQAKQKYLAMYGRAGAEKGWHFLTGDQASITALAQAVGFHYRWVPQSQQFAHAAGIMLLTPEGRVAQYYYGAKYFPSDIRLGLIQASQNHIGTLADQIVLYCCQWDPRTGRYGAIVSRVLQLCGGATLLILGGVMFFLIRAYPNQNRRSEHTNVGRQG